MPFDDVNDRRAATKPRSRVSVVTSPRAFSTRTPGARRRDDAAPNRRVRQAPAVIASRRWARSKSARRQSGPPRAPMKLNRPYSRPPCPTKSNPRRRRPIAAAPPKSRQNISLVIVDGVADASTVFTRNRKCDGSPNTMTGHCRRRAPRDARSRRRAPLHRDAAGSLASTSPRLARREKIAQSYPHTSYTRSPDETARRIRQLPVFERHDGSVVPPGHAPLSIPRQTSPPPTSDTSSPRTHSPIPTAHLQQRSTVVSHPHTRPAPPRPDFSPSPLWRTPPTPGVPNTPRTRHVRARPSRQIATAAPHRSPASGSRPGTDDDAREPLVAAEKRRSNGIDRHVVVFTTTGAAPSTRAMRWDKMTA